MSPKKKRRIGPSRYLRPKVSVKRGAQRTRSSGSYWLIDGVTVLTLFLIVRLILPSQFVIGGLGGAGSPAALLAVACLGWWVWERLHRTREFVSSPVVGFAAVFGMALMASWVAGVARPINGEEGSVLTLGLLVSGGWLGVLLVAHDGPLDSERLAALLNRLAVLAGLFAAFGLFQFVTGAVWVDRVYIPGLSAHQTVYAASVREGFTRPPGTAIHPIEFGAVLCMLLPIAISRGMGLILRPGTDWGVLRRWWPAALVALAVVLSLSRSALVGLAVGLIAILPALRARQRIGALVAMAGLGAIVFLVVPGMIGSIVGLFSGAQNDPGIASRIDSYAIAADYIARAPWFGRGMFTFLPRYRIFDNQYLLSLVEIGFVGVAALLALILAVLWAGIRTRSARSSVLRGASAATLAGSLVGGVSLALFDGFAFPMMPGIWFTLLGLTGAAYRLSREEAATTSS